MVIREAMGVAFYVRRSHREIAPQVMACLERFAREAGPALGKYVDGEEYKNLDAAGWEHIRNKILSRSITIATLSDVSAREERFRAEYLGRPFGEDDVRSDEMCSLRLWLPTEYLEEHGPDRFRALALELLDTLPIHFGTAGLVFNAASDLLGVDHILNDLCLRFPGVGLQDEIRPSHLGTKIIGPSWITFLGQPILGEMGGVEGLRARLHEPGTTLEPLSGERAIITLGAWPEAGDNKEGIQLPAYRELARILEPWLYREERPHSRFPFDSREELRRWERRFLD